MSTRRWWAGSTPPTPWRRRPPPWPPGSTWRRWPPGCRPRSSSPAAWNGSRPANPSPSWSTTPTRRTGWSRCCGPPGRWWRRTADWWWCSVAAATATGPSARPWARRRPAWPTWSSSPPTTPAPRSRGPSSTSSWPASRPGALFVALRAERDGHDFVADALDRGAAGALVSRGVEVVGQLVVVDDTAAALTALGGAARRRLAGVPVVGITGSTGKTSTKDLTAAALGAAGPVGASPVSFNNEIGVPLTLLSAPAGAVAVVAEMGARGVGHIATLAAVARPTVGVITNIGMAHAEFFGSREEVARAKGELLEVLPSDGHAVLSADDDMTPGPRRRTAAAVLTGGTAAGADVRVSGVRVDDDLRPAFRLDTPWGAVDVPPLPVRGAHQAGNAALAVAVAGIAGVGLEAAVAGLAGAVGSPWRMELRRTRAGLVVLNDAYNANPTSMAAALDALASLAGAGGRRFAVL